MLLVDVIHRIKNEYSKGITFYHANGASEYLSYSDIYKRAQKMLGILQKHNITAGDELILLLNNNCEFVIVAWACLMGGFVCIPYQTTEYNISLLGNFLEKCHTPYIIADETSLDLIKKCTSISEENILLFPERDILENETEFVMYESGEKDEIVMVLFSSGSVSDPKGAAMSNENIVSYLEGYCSSYTSQDIFVNWLPFTHNAGIVMSHFAPIFLGVEQYLVHPLLMMRNVGKLLEIITEKKATVTGTIRMHIVQMTELARVSHNHAWNLESIRAFVVGGEPISYMEIQEFINAMEPFGLNEKVMSCMYGLSETTSGVVKTQVGEPLSYTYLDRKNMRVVEKTEFIDHTQDQYYSPILSVGYPLKGIQIKICTADGDMLPEDKIGIIHMKGKQVINEYYGLKKEELKIKNRWLNTEDVGFIHQGQLYIVGRQKNMIFINSKNIFCEDMVQQVSDSLGIKQSELELIGIPSVDNNNCVICFKHANRIDNEFIESSKEIRRFCMENFGIKINVFIAISQFPKTSIGKIKIGDLREKFINKKFPENSIYRYDKSIEDVNEDTISIIKKNLLSIFSNYCKCELDLEENFFDYLQESMEISRIYTDIDNIYPDVLEIADLFQYFTINKLSTYLEKRLHVCNLSHE